MPKTHFICIEGVKLDFRQLEENVLKLASGLKGKVGLIIKADNEMISINGEEIFSSASLIKVPILFTAYHLVEKNLLNLQEKVCLKHEDKVGGSGVLQLLSEINLTIKDLLTLMISVSDNTATNIIIKKIGFESVNKVGRELGCNSTFLNRMMMDLKAIENGIDNTTSASDMILFLKEITEGTYLSDTSKNEIYQILSTQQLNDKLSFSIYEEELVIAHKTGELPGIEHDIAIFEYKEKQVLTSMLYDGGSKAPKEKIVFSYIGTLIQKFLTSK